MSLRHLLAFGLVLALTCGAARAADPAVPVKKDNNNKAATSKNAEDSNISMAHRASKLIGLKVHNNEKEDLGKIEDLVIDMRDGHVRYAVLSFGGFLGLGDKLFAVPMNSMRFNHDDKHFVLNVDKDRLDKAQGFDKDNWPDFADPMFLKSVDDYYQADAGASHEGIVLTTNDNVLTMSDRDGANKHSHRLGKDTKISLNGKPAVLVDLKVGDHVTVTINDRDGKESVAAVQAESKKVQR